MTRHIFLRLGSTVVNAYIICKILLSDLYLIDLYLFVTGSLHYSSYKLAYLILRYHSFLVGFYVL